MTDKDKMDISRAAIVASWIGENQSAQHQLGDFFFGRFDHNGNQASENPVTPNEIEDALKSLEADELVIGYHNDYAASRWYLNKEKAHEYHKTHIREPDHLLHQVSRLGHDWLAEVLENMAQQAQPEIDPTSSEVASEPTPFSTGEDEWEPLPIEYSSEAAKEAMEAVEKTIEAVRSDNGYTANYPEERDNILWALSAGVVALREVSLTRMFYESNLIRPLRKLIERFKDAVVGELAKLSVSKLISWISGGVS